MFFLRCFLQANGKFYNPNNDFFAEDIFCGLQRPDQMRLKKYGVVAVHTVAINVCGDFQL